MGLKQTVYICGKVKKTRGSRTISATLGCFGKTEYFSVLTKPVFKIDFKTSTVEDSGVSRTSLA